MTVPLSILDLSPISEGGDAAAALHNTIDLAQHAEQWGFKRYWIAEHHFVAVASSSPAVLIGQIAAATETHPRRRGRGAVGPHHRTVGRRELRNARCVLPRPHRPRGGPVRAAAPRGSQEAVREHGAASPSANCRRNGVTSAASSCRRRSISGPSSPTSCARRCRFCSNPKPSRRTSPTRSTTSSRCCTAATGSTTTNCTRCQGSEPP